MDNNVETLLSAQLRTDTLEQMGKADPLQLMSMAASLNRQDTEALEDVIASGWIRLFFTEWQVQLKQFAHRFVPYNGLDRQIRIMHWREASGLHSQLETFQIGRVLSDEGYFLNEEDGTLNIRCAFPKSYYCPYYQLPMIGIRGFLTDFHGDFCTDADAARDVRDPASSTTSADAVSLARKEATLLQQAFAASCLPQSFTVDDLKERLATIEDIASQYQSLMADASTVLPTAMWRIDLNIWFDDDTQPFHFFTFPADDIARLVPIQNHVVRVSSFDGVSGVFNRGDIESYAVIDTLTGKTIDSDMVCIDQDERYNY